MKTIAINEHNLEMLRLRVLADSDLSDEQRDSYLDTIRTIREGVASGDFTIVNRLGVIKQVVEKQNSALRKKLKTKSRQLRRKVTADKRALRSVDAFDEKFMYASDNEVRQYADTMGITDAYKETKRFDNEWN